MKCTLLGETGDGIDKEKDIALKFQWKPSKMVIVLRDAIIRTCVARFLQRHTALFCILLSILFKCFGSIGNTHFCN